MFGRAAPVYLWDATDQSAVDDARRHGWGDVSYAAQQRGVPALVQLGVLAHAPWMRLSALRASSRHSVVRRVWGTGVLAVVDLVLASTGDPEELVLLQLRRLQPAEDEASRSARFTRDDLVRVIHDALSVQDSPPVRRRSGD